MKQINFEQDFSEIMYNLKNKFKLFKLLASNIITFGVYGIILYILFFNNLITDLNLIYDVFFYGVLIIIPLDIYNIKK